MAERSSLTQGVQVGTESTPGTSVAANKKFISIGIDGAIKSEMNRFRPMGQKFASVVTPGKEWLEAKIEGVGSYSELTWMFASVLKDPGSPATVDTSGRTWTYSPAAASEDTVKTFTVEAGGAVRAHKWAYGLVTDLELTFNRSGVDVAGTMIGQRITDGITLTASPTTPPEVEILPTDVNVWVDPTSGALGTTKLTRVLEAVWRVGSRFNPVWVLNTANNSYVAHVEVEPTCEVEILMEADAAGMGYLTNMRAGTTNFCRIGGLSATLAGSSTAFYSLNLDTAIKVKDVSDFSDEDGVYAIRWTFEVVYDPTWAKAYNVVLTNKETTL